MTEEQEQRFRAIVKIEVTEITGGKSEPFFSSDLSYPNMNYAGVVFIEALLADVQQRLVQAGISTAKDSEQITALLAGKKPPRERDE